MKDARFEEIKELADRFDKLGDAAFLAVMQEHGVSVDDLVSYSREHEKRERAVRNARRVRR